MTGRSGESGRALPKRLSREGGFTITEMLVAVTIMLAITGTVFQLLNPAQGMFQAQPEVTDMQQRMRLAVDNLAKDLVMAGAGSYMGQQSGTLTNYFAPMLPYKYADDAPTGDYFDPTAITILYVPPTPAQTNVVQALGNNSQELDVEAQSNCGGSKKDQLCGFEEGMRVLIFDIDGSWDTMTITNVQDEALHLQHSGKLSGKYDSGSATLTQVATHTYYLKKDLNAKTFELRHFDGYQTDLPVVDNVVDLEFEYFGEGQPPRRLLNRPLTDPTGPWTTYGPKPLNLGVTHPSNVYPAGETCAWTVVDGQHVARAPLNSVLGSGGSQVKLEEAALTDGPWCPHANADVRFDADLLRVRRVRVKMRVQVAQEHLRGVGPLFRNPGTSTSAERRVPDQQITFDITPRNMNLGR
jgi:type II secretory pathway pseudopilin PulG